VAWQSFHPLDSWLPSFLVDAFSVIQPTFLTNFIPPPTLDNSSKILKKKGLFGVMLMSAQDLGQISSPILTN
jgi:hypothetical protein